MKTLLCTLLLTLTGLTANAAPEAAAPAKPAMIKPYRHVVLFQFKATATPEQVKGVETAFLALKAKIPAVQSLEWGKNVSPEGLNDGLTHAFFVTFADKKAIETGYLHHPEHEAFVTLLKPLLEKAVVVDYIVE